MTDLPIGQKAIDSKQVFRVKRKLYDIERHEAPLVIKCYSQVKVIDYDETYSPVVRYSPILFFLKMTVKYHFIIHQMDTVAAFLQGELSEEVYMRQPVCFIDQNHPDKVRRLKKSLSPHCVEQKIKILAHRVARIYSFACGTTHLL